MTKTFKATAFDPEKEWERTIRAYAKDPDMLIGFVRSLVAYQLSEQKNKTIEEIKARKEATSLDWEEEWDNFIKLDGKNFQNHIGLADDNNFCMAHNEGVECCLERGGVKQFISNLLKKKQDEVNEILNTRIKTIEVREFEEGLRVGKSDVIKEIKQRIGILRQYCNELPEGTLLTNQQIEYILMGEKQNGNNNL